MRLLAFVLLLVAGCSVDRSGLAADAAGATDGATRDAGPAPDGAARDGGVAPDGGSPACMVPELCNGVDDDCNPSTADGAGDPRVGTPCDGSDADLCPEGTTGCAGGALTCTDTTSDSAEICNGVDDDCDGTVDEPGATGEVTSWADGDHDGYGNASLPTLACSTPPGNVANGDDCNDADPAVHPAAAEPCDGRDEDCNGVIDDGAACGCPLARYGTHAYLFCNAAVTWSAAEAACAGSGYHLATIDAAAENTWVADTARAANNANWWLGATDAPTEGTWTWSSGLASTFTHWHSGQPNGGGSQNCLATNQWGDDTWNDVECPFSYPFVCEAGI